MGPVFDRGEMRRTHDGSDEKLVNAVTGREHRELRKAGSFV